MAGSAPAVGTRVSASVITTSSRLTTFPGSGYGLGIQSVRARYGGAWGPRRGLPRLLQQCLHHPPRRPASHRPGQLRRQRHHPGTNRRLHRRRGRAVRPPLTSLPTMDCEQRGQMHRHLRAYLLVRGGYGRRAPEPGGCARTAALKVSHRSTGPATASGSFAHFRARIRSHRSTQPALRGRVSRSRPDGGRQ